MTIATPETLGSRVRKARDSRGWCQKSLARNIGVSWTTIKNIEGDRHSPACWIVVRIAKSLGTTPNDLLGFHDE